MSQKLANLCECPTHKIEDRKALLQRVYDALLRDPDAVISFRGEFLRQTAEQYGNWLARQAVADLLQTFP